MLALRVIKLYEDVKVLQDIVKTFLSKPSGKHKAIEDFFFEVDVADADLRDDEWELTLEAKKFSDNLFTFGEGEDVQIEDAKELSQKIPDMIKGKYFKIDSYAANVDGSRKIVSFVFKIVSAKYDKNKDTLTAETEVFDADFR